MDISGLLQKKNIGICKLNNRSVPHEVRCEIGLFSQSIKDWNSLDDTLLVCQGHSRQ